MTKTLIKPTISGTIPHIAPLPEGQGASINLPYSNEKLIVKIANCTANAKAVYNKHKQKLHACAKIGIYNIKYLTFLQVAPPE